MAPSPFVSTADTPSKLRPMRHSKFTILLSATLLAGFGVACSSSSGTAQKGNSGGGGSGGAGGGGGSLADAAADQRAAARPPDVAAVGGIDGPVGTGGVGGREAGGTTSAGGTTTTGGTKGGAGNSSSGSIWGGTAPSCSGLAATCGPSGNDDCCKSLLVPGGTFDRSYDGVDFKDPNYPATVDDFYLDKYEITVGRFRQFVSAGMGTQASPPAAGAGAHPGITGSGWDSTWNTNLAGNKATLTTNLKCWPSSQTWTDTAGSNESKPVNCLDWYAAFAFCAWDGGRLATEAEWNYAAAGGDEQRYYPWSSPPTSTTIDDSYAVYCASNNPPCIFSIQNVGSKSPKGDGKWGQSDLAGNVWEWTLDWYAAYPSPCIDCADLTAATYRVRRGGGFDGSASLLRSADRSNDYPLYLNYYLGARCARTSL